MDRLDKETIWGGLRDQRTVYVLGEVDSTNLYARRLLSEGHTEPALIAAEHQTAGRGRLGRDFFSPAGSGLYMTLLLPCDRPLQQAVSITMTAAAAVCRALESLTGERFGIKWVNDIYYGGKKVCGILAESVLDARTGQPSHLILGIGVNVRSTAVPEELRDVMGFLPVPVDRNALAYTIANRLAAETDALPYYRARSLAPGHAVRYRENGIWRDAFALSIDQQGGLVVRETDGTIRALNSGEISLRLRKE